MASSIITTAYRIVMDKKGFIYSAISPVLILTVLLETNTVAFAAEPTDSTKTNAVPTQTQVTPEQIRLNDLQEQIKTAKQAGKYAQAVDASMALAEEYQSQAQPRTAYWSLHNATPLLRHAPLQSKLKLYHRLSSLAQSLGAHSDSRDYAIVVNETARQLNNEFLLAVTFNQLGAADARMGDYEDAINNFHQALDLAKKLKNAELIYRSRLNVVRAQIDLGDKEGIWTSLRANEKILASLDSDLYRVQQHLAMGELFRKAYRKFDHTSIWRKQAFKHYDDALKLAEKLKLDNEQAYAVGYMARLYADEGRIDEALSLTQQAAFSAQKVNNEESLYLWQKQLARLLWLDGQKTYALTAYEHAAESLENVLPQRMAESAVIIDEEIEPFYLQWFDLQLQQASKLSAKDQRQVLAGIKRQLRLLNVKRQWSRRCLVCDSGQREAVIRADMQVYMLPMMDRVELILDHRNQLQRFDSKVSISALEKQIEQFNKHNQKNPDKPSADNGRNLNQWLIKPIQAELTADNVRRVSFTGLGLLRGLDIGKIGNGNVLLAERIQIQPEVQLAEHNIGQVQFAGLD
ncbi:MAG: hypothetical protein OEY38_13610 [Gammaproteobacteria bacterium]|nr:hypothetical protein [Gammaproteobacteria bacterium]